MSLLDSFFEGNRRAKEAHDIESGKRVFVLRDGRTGKPYGTMAVRLRSGRLVNPGERFGWRRRRSFDNQERGE